MQRLFTPAKTPPTPHGIINETMTSDHICKSNKDRVFFTSNPDEILIKGPGKHCQLVNVLTSAAKTIPIPFKDLHAIFTLPDGRICYRMSESRRGEHSIVNKIYFPEFNKSGSTSIHPQFAFMLSPNALVYLDDGLFSYRLCIHTFSSFPTWLHLGFQIASIAPLGEHHIVVGGTYGEVCVYQKQENSLVKVDDITQELLSIRKKTADFSIYPYDRRYVYTMGAQRDTLIVVDAINKGMVSRWQFVDGKLKNEAHGFHTMEDSGSFIEFCELKGTNQFLLIGLRGNVTVWNEKLQSGVVHLKETNIGAISQLSDGRLLAPAAHWEIKILALGSLMSREEQVEFYRQRIDDAIPRFNNGPLVRMVADYLSGKEEKVIDDEKAERRPSL